MRQQIDHRLVLADGLKMHKAHPGNQQAQKWRLLPAAVLVHGQTHGSLSGIKGRRRRLSEESVVSLCE